MPTGIIARSTNSGLLLNKIFAFRVNDMSPLEFAEGNDMTLGVSGCYRVVVGVS